MIKFHKYRTHEDKRRKGRYDLVPGLAGDFNFTVHPKGIIPEELHMHKRQTDYFIVAKGKVMFLLIDKKGKKRKVVLDEKDHKTLIIKPGTWHGYTAIKPSMMIFYISHKYDPDDEFRKKIEASCWTIPKVSP